MAGHLYKLLNHFVIYNSLTGLPIACKWHIYPYNRFIMGVTLFYQYVAEMMEVLGFLGCLFGPPQVWDNIDALCGCLSSLIHSIQILLKTLHLRVRKISFMNHLGRFERIIERNNMLMVLPEGTSFEEYFKADSRYIKRIQHIHMFLVLCLTVVYFSPFFIIGFLEFEAGSPLPIVMYIPFDIAEQTGYQIGFVLQGIIFILFNVKMIAMDYLMIAIIILHTSQMRFLKDVLKVIIAENESNKQDNHRSLHHWVRQHQDSYRSMASLTSLLSEYLAVEYMYAIIHTCIPAFVITSTVSWSLLQKIALVTLVTGVLMVLYFLSQAGDALTSAGGEICEELYGSHLIGWKYGQSTYFMCSQLKPFYLRVASMFPLCFITFIAILRAIVTYYMALNEIQHIKKVTTE